MKRIRLIEKEDLDVRYEAISSPDVNKWLMLPLVSKARTENWFQSVISNKNRVDFVGTTDNSVFGFSGLTHINYLNKTAEVYIFLASSKCFSKGLGSWLLNETIKFGFKEMGITRFYAKVVCKNIQSKDFFLKNNFIIEGVLKQDAWIEGNYHDIILLAKMLKERVKSK